MPLAIVVVLAGTVGLEATEFDLGDWKVSFDNTISWGASMRMEDPDPNLIGAGNGGNGAAINTDDGNLNFEKGDVFSNIFKGVSELQFDHGNFGIFARVKYWYDEELSNGRRPHGHEPNDWVPNSELNDDGFNDFAKFSGLEMLDLFAYASFDIGSLPFDIRAGRQVVNWGESTFIQGINQVNPIDVSAFRRPGAQIKEGLLPVSLVYSNLGLGKGWSLENYYQLEWEATPIDGCGTYFSNVDFAAGGCQRLLVSNLAPDIAVQNFASVARDRNVEPDDGGQYGVALRKYVSGIDTEFGVYYQNLHSRTPVINVRYSMDAIDAGTILGPDTPAPAFYQIAYPEDITIYGLSFATNIGSVAVSGEISLKEDQPIGINGTTELIGGLGALNPAVCPSGMAGALVGPFGDRACAALGEFMATGDGVAEGYDRFDVHQAQATALYFWENALGSDRMTLIAEAAWIEVADLPDVSVMPYGRNPVFGPGAVLGGTDEGFMTSTSWGYRFRAALDYPNVFAGVSLSPNLAWSHDVSGTSPAPTFIEGRKAFSVGVNANYLARYRASLSYTIFSGGEESNTGYDRDFISVMFAVDF